MSGARRGPASQPASQPLPAPPALASAQVWLLLLWTHDSGTEPLRCLQAIASLLEHPPLLTMIAFFKLLYLRRMLHGAFSGEAVVMIPSVHFLNLGRD